MFMDSEDFTQLKANLALSIDIVPQLTKAEIVEIQQFKESVTSSVTTFSLSQIAINLILAKGLKYLLFMIYILQFVVFMQQW